MKKKSEKDILSETIETVPVITKEKSNTDNVMLKKDLQYNEQDLDQQQKMELNPVQSNTQHLNIYIDGSKDYSGKISGITYLQKNKDIVPQSAVFLFFGNETRTPLSRTESDISGRFSFEDIPPGIYSLYAKFGSYLKYEASFIKVMPCQHVSHSVFLI